MSFSQARSKAVQELGDLKHILEFEKAWVFFGAQEFDNTLVIMKSSGETLTYSEFLMKYDPTEEPKKLK